MMRFLGLLFVLVLGFVAHRGALDHGFVAWDDDINLYENPNLIHEDIRWAHTWAEPYQGLWIPVTYTAWSALASVGRAPVAPGRYALDPAVFHGASLALHLASVALVFLLVLRRLPVVTGSRRTLAATAGALLFAVHPIQVEAVHWATSMKDTLSVFLALASLALVPLAPRRFGWRLPLAWLLFGLALLAKPAVVVLPVVWLLLVVASSGRPGRRGWIHFTVLLGEAAAVALVARLAQPAEAAADALAVGPRVAIALDSLGFYLSQIGVPRAFCPDYGRQPAWVLAQGLPTAAMLVGGAWLAATAVLAACRRWRDACLMLAFPAAIGPVLGVLSFSHQRFSTVADRYAYLAMAVMACVLAQVLVHPRWGRVWPVVVGALLLCVGRSQAQAVAWQDAGSLWQHVLDVNPRSASAWTNLGWGHDQAGRETEALDCYENAIAAEPAFALAHNNVGNIHYRRGRLDEAEQAYRRGLRANPHDLHGRNNLGAVFRARGKTDRALVLFEAVVETNPRFSPAHHNLGLVAMDRGEWAEAERHVRAALAIDPGFLRAHLSLAQVLARNAQRDVEARQHLALGSAQAESDVTFELRWTGLLAGVGRPLADLRRARIRTYELGWRDPVFLAELGHGLASADEPLLAEEVLGQAIRRSPGSLQPRLDLGRMLEHQERWQELRALMVRAVRDFPRSPEAWHMLAVYQLAQGRTEQARALVRSTLELAPEFAPALRLAADLGMEAVTR